MTRIADEWASERMSRNIVEVLLALREGANPENVPEGAASYIADFWENVASLVRARHVDRKLFHEFLGAPCRTWWATLAPFVGRFRIEFGDPRGGEHFEWLAGVMAEMDRNARVGATFDAAFLAGTLDRRIQNDRDRIRLAEELRAVIIRPMSPAAPPAPPAPPPQTEAAPASPPA